MLALFAAFIVGVCVGFVACAWVYSRAITPATRQHLDTYDQTGARR